MNSLSIRGMSLDGHELDRVVYVTQLIPGRDVRLYIVVFIRGSDTNDMPARLQHRPLPFPLLPAVRGPST